ncbi:MAG: glycosyltransferase family 4 protein [Chloroflexota bacterium]|nr:glycosyltransferase family 4 protein [Chloroflexota bacterium]
MLAVHLLIISRCPPVPLHLGDRLILYHLARQLRVRGWTLDLLAFYQDDDDPALFESSPARAFFRYAHLIRETPRTQWQYLQRALLPATRFPARAEAAWSHEMWRAIEQRLAGERYDAIQLLGGVQVYEFANALGGQPAIITPYESYSLYLKRQIASGQGAALLTLQRQLARLYEGFMFTPYARTVVVSEQDRAELQDIHPALSVEVIPNGINLDDWQPLPVQREPATLIFTGNLDYAPNRDAALYLAREVLPAVRRSVPAARLLLVGNAPPPEVQALTSDHVVVTGRVEDMRPYLARATLYVCPLRFGAGIKNKVLEALAMGCPVIATPLSADGIAVRDGHDIVLVPADQFADRVVSLLNDARLRQALSANGRALITARYDWVQVADAYERLYAAVGR